VVGILKDLLLGRAPGALSSPRLGGALAAAGFADKAQVLSAPNRQIEAMTACVVGPRSP